MRSSQTVGFAIEEDDRPRLDHLAQVFGAGNRSAFLRRALDIMELLEAVQSLADGQAYGAARLAEADMTPEDLPAFVDQVLADPDPQAVAQAKIIVADVATRWAPPVRSHSDRDEELLTVFDEVRTEERTERESAGTADETAIYLALLDDGDGSVKGALGKVFDLKDGFWLHGTRSEIAKELQRATPAAEDH